MTFTADWLALRADADRRARHAGLAGALAAAMDGREEIRSLDLGAGTGAGLRAISPLLPARQRWVLADADAALLARIETPPGISVEPRVADLAVSPETLFDPAPDLVTTSAFLDLCGAAAADRIVALTVSAGAAFHAALSYDGRQDWRPIHPLDEAVIAAFNADQRRNKGLGPALGPDAAAHVAAAFRRRGYAVRTAPSDWNLTAAHDAALIDALAQGTAEAIAPVLGRRRATEWQTARADAEAVMIGHVDVLALPAAPVGAAQT